MCNTCGTSLSVTAGSCTKCGDSDPFLKSKILAVRSSLTTVTLITLLVIPIIFIVTLVLSVNYKSWIIGFIGFVGILICYLDFYLKLGRRKLREMEKLVLPSFSSFVKEKEPGFTDEHGYYIELKEDNFLSAWEAYISNVIGRSIPIHLELSLSSDDDLHDEIKVTYQNSLK